MADSKKYDGSTWEHSLRKLTTATDTITSLPADLYADGNNATVGLQGNMQQTGTPTPQNPIQPSETGERTGNLFDYATQAEDLEHHTAKQNFYLNSSGGEQALTSWWISDYIEINSDTVTVCQVGGNTPAICCYDSNKEYIRGQSYMTGGAQVLDNITLNTSGAKYVRFSFYRPVSGGVLMLVEGSTAPSSFIPYGYKIPILSANTTTPVYLGEVQSTRQIKQLVLTGEESVSVVSSSQNKYFRIELSETGIETSFEVCTHFVYGQITSTNTTLGFRVYTGVGGTPYVSFRPENYESTTGPQFKAYLAEQYAAGTPVTIWYVLATETTGIVNEPLRKIGTYADTVSGITIPTITGKDTFDVLTTLKPSEVSLTYTGWHDASVGEWDGSEWQ